MHRGRELCQSSHMMPLQWPFCAKKPELKWTSRELVGMLKVYPWVLDVGWFYLDPSPRLPLVPWSSFVPMAAYGALPFFSKATAPPDFHWDLWGRAMQLDLRNQSWRPMYLSKPYLGSHQISKQKYIQYITVLPRNPLDCIMNVLACAQQLSTNQSW